MKSQNLSAACINLYLVAGMVHIVMMAAGNDQMVLLTKYALMPLLWLYVITSAGFVRKVWLLSLALAFSWLGDIFLLYVAGNPMNFTAGLASFLVAHIFYIACFLQMTETRVTTLQLKMVIPFAVFCIALLAILYPSLGDMRLPVIAYGMVITSMGIAALHRLGKTSRYSFGFVFTGALLFIASDSLIAVNKFLSPFNSAPYLIMLTYIAAQYLIVSGCVLHLKEKAPL